MSQGGAARSVMSGRRVLAWGDLDARRRRGRLSPALMVAGAAGLLVGAEAARRAGWYHGQRGLPSPTVVIAVLLCGFVPAMFGAPYRMFWRRDAALLARLPVPGAALWQAALVRATRAAAVAGLLVAPTVVVVVVGDPAAAGRVAVLVAALALATIGLVPAACLGAAYLVASGKAADLTRSLAGSDPLPSTSVLGALPGAVIAGVVLAVIFAEPWLIRASPAGLIGVALVGGGALIAGGWASAAAARVYPVAMREVAALDRQVHAHLEIDPPTLVERTVGARLGRAAPVYGRLCRLIRRRYPLVGLGGLAGAITAVAVAAADPAELGAWLGAAGAGLGAIAAWLAGALARPPVELPRLTATLPIAPAVVSRARRAYLAVWVVLYAIAPSAIAVGVAAGRGGRPITVAIALAVGLVTAAALVGMVTRAGARTRAASAPRYRRRDRPG